MGDLRDWWPEPNGTLLEERPSYSLSPSSSSFCNQTVIAEEYLQRAEAAADGIIAQVHPTVESENRRKAVIDYVHKLIRDCLGCEVFPFGSVPLKTYLPDGDIDLTAFGGFNFEEALASEVCAILEREEKNSVAEFIVKDVQLIRAEVKLVKCLVQNIVVDISFNQLGGLCTLCFLEEVDDLIGKDHLFKRSIILIKAWCYYESRILGAHHGLISTYALETLVLYIFHLFNRSLDGPLAVLYKFLEYFSKFDWDNYCISLYGPVRVSSLPEIITETTENGGRDLLLSHDFLKRCTETFSVPSRGFETTSRAFHPKHLNIVDPLKENNNLGRSVSKGNFYRIRSAFTYGARKLGNILSQPEDNIDEEIRKFFSNTLDRHGGEQRPDVQDPFPIFGQDGLGTMPSFSGRESKERTNSESESGCSSGISGEFRLDQEGLLCNGVNKLTITGTDVRSGRVVNESQGSLKVAPSTMLPEIDSRANGIVSDYRISGDAKDLATSRTQSLSVSPNSSHSNGQDVTTRLGRPLHAPHLFFSRAAVENGDTRNGKSDKTQPENSSFAEKKLSSRVLLSPAEETGFLVNSDQDSNRVVNFDEALHSFGSNTHPLQLSSVALSSENLYPGYSSNRAFIATGGTPLAAKSLSDLTGEWDSHIYSLEYGRCFYDHALSAPIAPVPPPLTTQFQNEKSWDVTRQPLAFKRNMFSHMNANGVVPRPFYPMSPPMLPNGVPFGVEDIPKPRGTGTYIPNMNHYRERPSTARGKTHAPPRSPRNNRAMTPLETNFPEKRNREFAPGQFSHHHSGGNYESLDHPFASLGRKPYPNTNGMVHPPERIVEFGSIGHLSVEVPMLESSKRSHSRLSAQANPNGGISSPGRIREKPVLDINQDRIAAKSYQLKDQDDFPPLSI
ncbi:PAP/OAS1 substrate-binding domain superfamily [Quillaja saponaria]|uniref:PAP/OAS1 substrate-binding domain superfamily n=1 Tax=Quillaja saponaria TaxID=32244 RepID=A0AAD7LNC2_QUISA|nr:PAP/OAS1 substrate-binding domain superfamily [Quillaja saponaria]